MKPQGFICIYLIVDTIYNSTWSDAFGIYTYSLDKAFLGWSTEVGTEASLMFCSYFWPLISISGSVSLAAAQAVSYASYYYCPISFTGDYYFDGYHY